MEGCVNRGYIRETSASSVPRLRTAQTSMGCGEWITAVGGSSGIFLMFPRQCRKLLGIGDVSRVECGRNICEDGGRGVEVETRADVVM